MAYFCRLRAICMKWICSVSACRSSSQVLQSYNCDTFPIRVTLPVRTCPRNVCICIFLPPTVCMSKRVTDKGTPGIPGLLQIEKRVILDRTRCVWEPHQKERNRRNACPGTLHSSKKGAFPFCDCFWSVVFKGGSKYPANLFGGPTPATKNQHEKVKKCCFFACPAGGLCFQGPGDLGSWGSLGLSQISPFLWTV